MAGVVVLWVLVCFLVVRSKKRSLVWVLFAALGPLGFVVLASLNDRTATEPDSYTRFLRKMNTPVRAGYEVLSFLIIWELAWQAMILMSTLMVRYEAFTTGVSVAQIIRCARRVVWNVGIRRGDGSDVPCRSSLPAAAHRVSRGCPRCGGEVIVQDALNLAFKCSAPVRHVLRPSLRHDKLFRQEQSKNPQYV